MRRGLNKWQGTGHEVWQERQEEMQGCLGLS